MTHQGSNTSQRVTITRQRGFTLVELMVAILVLVVVILATSRIFGTASQVTGMGQALSSVMQEAAALERAMREDIARLSSDGYFAIRQVAVRNDINLASTGQLLNPFLADEDIIRADQLVFFANGVQSMQNMGIGENDRVRGQSTSSRVYYGHGVQLANAQPANAQSQQVVFAHDPGPAAASNNPNIFELRPWRDNTPLAMVRTRIATGSSSGGPNATTVYSRGAGGTPIIATQPDALNWVLCRQPVALVDDDQAAGNTNSKTVYLDEIRTARSIFIDHVGRGHTREIRNGRLDAAATRTSDIRRYVQYVGENTANARPWNNPMFGSGVNADQRSMIASSVYYPRAERYAPSMNRVDHALTNTVIGSAVSSFIIEWTWEAGTGEVNTETFSLPGFELSADNSLEDRPEQPWFGLNMHGPPGTDRGVGFMGFNDGGINDPEGGQHYWQRANFRRPASVFVSTGLNNADNNVERYYNGPGLPYNLGPNVWVYEALFGYNRDTPVATNPANGALEAYRELGYTPWPTAIRVTVVMHDPAGKLEYGREFQFVIDLPRRTKSF